MMEMKLNQKLMKRLRQERVWTQDQLAEIAGLSKRTIQRIEKHGHASLESARSLAAVFELSTNQLTVPSPASRLPLVLSLLLILVVFGLILATPVAAEQVMLNVVLKQRDLALADVHLLNDSGAASELRIDDHLKLIFKAVKTPSSQYRIKVLIYQDNDDQTVLAAPEIITDRQQSGEIHFADYVLQITPD